VIIHTDGSVEKAKEQSKNDESGVPMPSAGYCRDAKIHEDDHLCHRGRQLDDAFDRRLRLDGDVCFTEFAQRHRAQHTTAHDVP